jgi:hypothetical protein
MGVYDPNNPQHQERRAELKRIGDQRRAKQHILFRKNGHWGTAKENKEYSEKYPAPEKKDE